MDREAPVIARYRAPPNRVPPAAIAVPAAAVTAPAAAVKAAAAVTGDLHNIGGHGRRRGGDRCRLSRRGIGHGGWCGDNGYRGSTRRQRWCDVLQSDSHRVTPSLALFRGPFPELRSSEAMSSRLTPLNASPPAGICA